MPNKSMPLFLQTLPLQAARLKLEASKAQVDARSHEDTYAEVSRFIVESGAEFLRPTLIELAAQRQKTAAQVDEDLWKMRTEKAQEFKPFELQTYDGKTVKLADLRGKVVLVSFWFPTCTGCIEEFPYFQQLLEKYEAKTDKFVLLTVNMFPSQDSRVLPLLKKKNVNFTVLRAPDEEWAQKTYGFYAAPSNYLLDAQGRVIYHPRASNPIQLKAVEAQIDELLARAEGK